MSKFLSSLAVALVLASSAVATCTNPIARKSWSNLTDTEKSNYLNAELCLMNPETGAPKTGIAGSTTIWEELQVVHDAQVLTIHTVGSFLPWHRYYMYVHETLLRNVCNYTGPLPYWDEQADQAAAPIGLSSIFDPVTGFGSNTTDADDCVDGPFANLTVNLRQDLSRGHNTCLTRSLSQSKFDLVAQSEVDECHAIDNYEEFNICAGNSIHVMGHFAVGGLMNDVALSPGDPLFFMHHTNLDRIWWEWQSKNLTARLTDMGGDRVGTAEILTSAQPESYPLSVFKPYWGDNRTTTTLNHRLWVGDVMPNVTIADVMNIQGDLLCWEYL